MAEDILSLRPMIVALANGLIRRLPGSIALDDVIAEGWMGAVEAHAHFDPARGVPFRLYARYRAYGAMLDYLRRLDSLSRRERQQAAESGLTRQRMVSLETLCFERDGKPLPLKDIFPAASRDRERITAEIDLARIMARADLSPRTVQILRDYFWLERTQLEIAKGLGIAESRVNQIITRSLVKMKAAALPPKALHGEPDPPTGVVSDDGPALENEPRANPAPKSRRTAARAG